MNSERIVFIFLRIGASVMLAWALARHPIDFFTILRIVVTATCAYGVYLAVRWKRPSWVFPFGALAVLFNPLWPMVLRRTTWAYIDIATAAFLLLTIPFLKETRQKPEQN